MAEKQMADDGDQFIIDIEENLEKVHAEFSLPKIWKVPEHLRSVNAKAYEPEVIAIGPFTYELRSKKNLKLMEEHKKRYLKKLLERRGEKYATSLVSAMRELEDEARRFYSEPVSLSSGQFVKMMLLDACFIVELFRKRIRSNDPVFSMLWIPKKVCRDLLLAENQLPFFVLQKFYGITETPEDEDLNFHQLILDFFVDLLPYPLWTQPKLGFMGEEIKHLLGFIHDHCWVWNPRPLTIMMIDKWKFIRCATKLGKVGIKFEKQTGQGMFDIDFDEDKGIGMFDIDFDEDKGIMKIPSLKIDDDTESLIGNLIAYEHSSVFSEYSPFVSYVKLMSCLINARNDVNILSDGGIFNNNLGDDEVVANMFNRLGDSAKLNPYNYYGEIFENVNRYCDKRIVINRWLACFDYFKTTPWAVISFCAALVLLILTSAQTVFSVLAYYR